MAAPTFIQEAETTWTSAASASTKTTASFTTLAGDILVGVAGSEDNGRAPGSIGGGGLTWTEKNRVAVASYCQALIASATATAQSMTANIPGFNGNANFYGLNVLTFRGSAGVGATAKTNVLSGAPSLSITTTGANSAIVVVVLDWSAQDGTSRTWRTVNSITPTAGNGMERTYFRDAAAYTVYAAYYSDAGAAGAKTVGLSAPGSQKYAIVALEVLAGSGAQTLTLIPATEADAAVALSVVKPIRKTVTPATSTTAAVTMTHAKRVMLTPAAETDGAQAMTRSKRKTLVPATETDTPVALVVIHPQYRTLTPATETDAAVALTHAKRVVIISAAEIDTAVGIRAAHLRSLIPATETDTAVALSRHKLVRLIPATELDTAVGLVLPHFITLTPALETDTAIAIELFVPSWDLISPWFTPGSVVDVVPLTNANERAWAHERVEQRVSQPYKLVIPIRPRQTPVLSAIAGDDGVARFLTVPPGKYWIVGEVDGIVRRVARTI